MLYRSALLLATRDGYRYLERLRSLHNVNNSLLSYSMKHTHMLGHACSRCLTSPQNLIQDETLLGISLLVTFYALVQETSSILVHRPPSALIHEMLVCFYALICETNITVQTTSALIHGTNSIYIDVTSHLYSRSRTHCLNSMVTALR